MRHRYDHDWESYGQSRNLYKCEKCGQEADAKVIAMNTMFCSALEEEMKEEMKERIEREAIPDLRVVDIKPEKDIKNEIMEEAEVLINQRTVELLEEMLELAKDGHVVEVMLIGFRDDGCMVSSFTDTMDYIRRLGALEFLKYRFQSDDQEDT